MGSHGQEHGHGHGHSVSEDLMTEMLDLDGEVLADHLGNVTEWIAGHLGDHPVRTIIDLGAGTGTGTFALLSRFGDATVTAVDASAGMLEHLTDRARRSGDGGRVVAREIDLDAQRLGGVSADLVWASASMHHMSDPARVLEDLRGVLTPGGLFAMIEFETFPRFLPDDIGLGAPGLEDRLNAIADRAREEHHPTVNSDWTATLTASGFAVREERTFRIDQAAPLSEVAKRYARVTLTRLREGAGDRLAPADHTTLGALLDEDGPHRLENRTDLSVRSERRAWIAAAG
ncbi:class I SAM-dependent methyltransferase [Kineosporia succinea]|uniref:SAM-dependent methyltransferase n=1 Tax=Kineosporia succinea TaxID=84632 RepID=A0ABT9NYA1_9ACTN|nr:class I SAM-dependent methyltransferase [Kineosporia succinea]MDP9825286.1 SAM-dependent methyltransferase [Kineosporia succinea]